MAVRILLIEDDEALITLLEYNLAASGYAVTAASSAEGGELIIAEQTFDLVILD